MSGVSERCERLVTWLRQQVTDAGCRGTVVGLSGGIDSAVVAGLCKRAFGDRVFGVIMPCHSSSQDAADAKLVAAAFKIQSRTVALDEVYDQFLATLRQGFQQEPTPLALANLKPRLRMITLYFHANSLGYLVVGTGNRSEATVGYFTKYGDGGVDLQPIANLVKTEVRELAEYLGVPRPVIDKAPSAGLWSGQTDETEMGFTYEALDRYILTDQADPSVKEKVDRMNRLSEHKRRLPPAGPR
ncbi:MAG: NAD(+) synthase [Symbiobacteriia bacterium]